MPTKIYFYIERNLETFIMSTQNMINSCGSSNLYGSIRTQKMSTQKMSNSRFCSTDESKSKRIHKMDISVNMSKLKNTKYEEPLVTDN